MNQMIRPLPFFTTTVFKFECCQLRFDLSATHTKVLRQQLIDVQLTTKYLVLLLRLTCAQRRKCLAARMSSRTKKQNGDLFLSLRTKLSECGYTHAFSIDSVDIINQLFNELQTAKIEYSSYRDMQSRITDDLQLAQQQLLPLRKENAKLHRENYKLHLEDISQNDAIARLNNEHELKLKELEDRVHHHIGLNDVLQQQCREAENEAKRIRDAYQALTASSANSSDTRRNNYISKPLKPTVAATLDGQSKYHFVDGSRNSASVISFESEKKAQDAVSRLPSHVENDARIIRTMRTQVETLTQQLEDSKADIAALHASVTSREQELRRNIRTISSLEGKINNDPTTEVTTHGLGASGGGRDSSVDQLEAVDIANRRLIDQLNGQVDFLNEQLAMKEAQVKEMTALARASEQFKHDIMLKNDQILAMKNEQSRLITQLRIMHEQLQVYGKGDAPLPGNAALSPRALSSNRDGNEGFVDDDGLSDLERIRNRLSGLTTPGGRNGEQRKHFPDEASIDDPEEVSSSVPDKSKTSTGPDANMNINGKKELLVWKGEVRALRTKVEQLESKNKSLSVEDSQNTLLIGKLNAEVDGLTQQLRTAYAEVEKLRAEREVLQSKHAQSENAISAATVSFQHGEENMSAEVARLTAANDSLRSEIKALQTAQVEANSSGLVTGRQMESMQALLKAAEHDAAVSQGENREMSNKITELQGQVRVLEAQVIANGRLRSSLNSSLEGKDALRGQLEAELADVKEQLRGSLSREKFMKESVEIMKLDQQNRGGDSSALLARYQSEIEEKDRLLDQLEDKLIALQRDVIHAASTENEKNKDKDNLPQNSVSTSSNEPWQQRYQTLLQQYEVLSLELSSKNKELSAVRGELESNDAVLQELHAQAASHQAVLLEAMQQREAAEGKVRDLQVLHQTMDANAKLSQQKQSTLTNSLENKETMKERLEAELQQTQEELRLALSREKACQESFQELLQERDTVVDTLNQHYEAHHLVVKQSRGLEDQNLQMKQLLERQEKKLRVMESDYLTLQRQHTALQDNYSHNKEEYGSLKRRLQQQNGDLAGAASDLMLMTQENQAYTSQLSTLAHEKEVLLQKITELTNVQHTMQQNYRALELERDDLVQSYRLVLQEKKKLEHDCHVLGVARQESGVQLNELYGQVAELKGQVSAQYSQENKLNVEKSSLGKHVEGLNENIAKYQRKTEALEADNRRLMQDNYNIKQSNIMLNERIQLLVKRSTSAVDNNRLLAHKLTAMESERDALRLLMSAEKQKMVDAETLLHLSRVAASTNNAASRSGVQSISGNRLVDTHTSVDTLDGGSARQSPLE